MQDKRIFTNQINIMDINWQSGQIQLAIDVIIDNISGNPDIPMCQYKSNSVKYSELGYGDIRIVNAMFIAQTSIRQTRKL